MYLGGRNYSALLCCCNCCTATHHFRLISSISGISNRQQESESGNQGQTSDPLRSSNHINCLAFLPRWLMFIISYARSSYDNTPGMGSVGTLQNITLKISMFIKVGRPIVGRHV